MDRPISNPFLMIIKYFLVCHEHDFLSFIFLPDRFIFWNKWEPVGCYINKAPKALPIPYDIDVSSVSGNDAIFEHCRVLAEEFKYKTFGVDGDICWAGNDAGNTYDKYGVSNTCSVSKTSGHGSGKSNQDSIFVYQFQ